MEGMIFAQRGWTKKKKRKIQDRGKKSSEFDFFRFLIIISFLNENILYYLALFGKSKYFRQNYEHYKSFPTEIL